MFSDILKDVVESLNTKTFFLLLKEELKEQLSLKDLKFFSWKEDLIMAIEDEEKEEAFLFSLERQKQKEMIAKEENRDKKVFLEKSIKLINNQVDFIKQVEQGYIIYG